MLNKACLGVCDSTLERAGRLDVFKKRVLGAAQDEDARKETLAERDAARKSTADDIWSGQQSLLSLLDVPRE